MDADKKLQRTISIHALREEGDVGESKNNATFAHFYPRPP